MAQENIIVKLPVSGEEAEIRGYVRRKDQKRIENAMFDGDLSNLKNIDGNIAQFVMGNKAKDAQVKTMLVRLGKNYNLSDEDVENLNNADFEFLLAETNKIFNAKKSSPKE